MGYDTQNDNTAPYEYFSILIPIIGLFFGILNYRNVECNGQMGFWKLWYKALKFYYLAVSWRYL
ncbi:hypothetical protein [Mucilaginibacter humi]